MKKLKSGNPDKSVRSAVWRIARVAVLVMGVLSIALGTHYFMKYSAMVDKKLSGDVFKRSAKLYAAAQGRADGLHREQVVRVEIAARDDVAAKSAQLMTTFFDTGRVKRRLVEFREIPKVLVDAVLTGEDRVFFDHYGINPRRIAGAFLWNLRHDRQLQGGSTITQQLARNLFLDTRNDAPPQGL